MCESQKPTPKPKESRLEDVLPMNTLEERAIVWGISAASRVREEHPILQELQSELDAKIRAAIMSVMQLADPKVTGSDELLQAIIERRREKMN